MGDFQKDPQIQNERQVSSHEGENTRDVPYLLSENQVRLAQNMIINEPGRRKMRAGAGAFGAPGGTPGGCSKYHLANSRQRFIAVCGNHPYDSGGNAHWDQVATSESLIDDRLHMFVEGRSGDGRSIYICQCERGASGPVDQSEILQYDIASDNATRASASRGTAGSSPRAVAVKSSHARYVACGGSSRTPGRSAATRLTNWSRRAFSATRVSASH